MQQESSLFSLSIDPPTKNHLAETAKWARFLAIVGFIFVAIFFGLAVLALININRYNALYEEGSYRRITTAATTGTAVGYIILSVISIFPFLYIIRFANHMKKALNTDNQELLNASFLNLKVYFRYIGVLTIIFLVLMALGIVLAIIGKSGV